MDGFEKARKIINQFDKRRPIFVCCTNPTGPTGIISGPTGPTGATAQG